MAAPASAAGAPPDDPYLPQQWAVQRVRAVEAWEATRGSGVVIAIVDSGVDLVHPDLEDRLLRDDRGRVVGHDFVDDDAEPLDEHGHGTMVAGIAAATAANGAGIVGVAPRARIMPVRVLDEQAAGTAADVAAGIDWAVDHGADVINLSLESAVAEDGTAGEAPAAAVAAAWRAGVVVVAAAGNDGSGFDDYPRRSPVLLVGATDRDDRRAGFSDDTRSDAVVAPGVEIVSTWRCLAGANRECPHGEHSYGQSSGTSYAAPHVAGVVALLRADGLDPVAALRRVRASARDGGARGRDAATGYGLIDAAVAVDVREPLAASPSPASPSPAETTPGSPSPTATSTETATAPPTSPAATTTPPSTTPSPGTSPPSTSPTEVSTTVEPVQPPASLPPNAGQAAQGSPWPWIAGGLVAIELIVIVAITAARRRSPSGGPVTPPP